MALAVLIFSEGFVRNVIKRNDTNVLFDTYYWHVFISKTSTNLLWSSTYFFSTYTFIFNRSTPIFFVIKYVPFATNIITSNLLFSRRILSSFSSNSHQVFFSEKFCNTHSYFSNVLWFFLSIYSRKEQLLFMKLFAECQKCIYTWTSTTPVHRGGI